MSTFFSATLGLLVVFLLAAGVVYSAIRIYRAVRTEPLAVADELSATKSGASKRARNGTEHRTHGDSPAHGANQSTPPVGKPVPAYIENDEEPVPVIFRRPA